MTKDRPLPQNTIIEFVIPIVVVLTLLITPKPPLTGSAKDGLLLIAIAPAAIEILAIIRPGIMFSLVFRRYLSRVLSALQVGYGILSLWAIYRWNLYPSKNYYEPYIGLMAVLVVALGVLHRAVSNRNLRTQP